MAPEDVADDVADALNWLHLMARGGPTEPVRRRATLLTAHLEQLAQPCACPQRTLGGPVTGRRIPDNNWHNGPSAGPQQTGWDGS